MSKTCQGKYNEKLERWEAIFQGKVLASNRDRVGGPEYLRRVIEVLGTSVKAKNLGVTKIEFVDEVV
ncbi:hypothetical protein, partial [Citrobacter braakii]|uniref:hypothetical protein n=1 Tax=Citrobacter braakii TaxID=57706 RepID=UPI001980127A